MWGPDVCHHYIVLGVILENTNIVELTGRILPELAPNLRSLGQRGAGGLATLLTAQTAVWLVGLLALLAARLVTFLPS